jgi:2-oxoisovalerate dehydrogenase E1 component alpha subunit
MEASVSRLYGHSSATGANLIPEVDCLKEFEQRLLKHDVIKEKAIQQVWADYEEEARQAQEQARLEPVPSGESVWEDYYANGENGDWRNF